MSLVVRISVNDDPPIAFVMAQRVAGEAEPDSVNTYDCAVLIPARLTGGRGVVKRGQATVEHRYGDGALVLARKALEAMT